MSGFEGMGYRIGGKALYVGDLPGRKQTCLYVQDGSTIRTLAFFKTEKQAKRSARDDRADRIGQGGDGL